jgi:hypothetical protein
MQDRKITERQPREICSKTFSPLGSNFKNNHFAYIPLGTRKKNKSENNIYCCIPKKICSIQ